MERTLEDTLLMLNSSVSGKEYKSTLNTLNVIFKHLAEAQFILSKNFTRCMETLLRESIDTLPSRELDTDLISCLATSFRICRNACAKFAENQTVLRSEVDLLVLVKDLLLAFGGCDNLNEELLVLARCAVQCLGNFASGNLENQVIVVDLFSKVFSLLLQVQDEKLQQYTCMVIHGCLSGLTDSPEMHQRVVDSADCWTPLLAVVKLCVERECPWGLYVIEDAYMYPAFCDNVYKALNAQERVLVLEVLANHLKSISEDEDVERVRTSLPHICNLQHISDHCKSCAEGILTIHDRGSHEELESLVTVKELECLSLATALHKSYGSLQEDTALLKTCIGLLHKIDEIGRQGNNIFSSVEKIAREGEINLHHPVFGLKRDIIRLIGNMGYKHKQNQDLVRELEGIPLILDQTGIDGKNPFITQWSVFAIHNLTENNEENKQFIADLRLQGVANNQAVLEDYGIEVKQEGDKISVKKLKR